MGHLRGNDGAFDTMTCPKCKNKLEIIGIECPVLYDGVVVWHCLKCNHYFARKGFEKEHKIFMRRYGQWINLKKGGKDVV